mmetsp:Transcript_18753/g.71352  ORF Transcript_18753/g.71352 Transcript_18753/m.71352 type:complete len:220 (+) Transcript_18753:568-1227(+)
MTACEASHTDGADAVAVGRVVGRRWTTRAPGARCRGRLGCPGPPAPPSPHAMGCPSTHAPTSMQAILACRQRAAPAAAASRGPAAAAPPTVANGPQLRGIHARAGPPQTHSSAVPLASVARTRLERTCMPANLQSERPARRLGEVPSPQPDRKQPAAGRAAMSDISPAAARVRPPPAPLAALGRSTRAAIALRPRARVARTGTRVGSEHVSSAGARRPD